MLKLNENQGQPLISMTSLLRKRFIFSTLLIITTISCQAVTRLTRLTPTFTSIPETTASTQTILTPSPSPTFTVTYTPILPPTHTNTPTITPTIRPPVTPSMLQREIFEELWRIVRDDYLYPDFNGLDWNAIYQEYSQRIAAGITSDEFYITMDEMISRLGDDHSDFLTPKEAAEEDAEYAGNLDYVGIGVLLSAVPERQRAVILLTFPGSPAEEARLKSHDSILSVNGEPILDQDGFLRDIVRGPEGTTITLMVQSPGELPRQVQLTRRRISGPIPVPYQVLISPKGLRVGYLLLVTFADSNIDEQLGEALQSMNREAPLDALIIDDRPNEGGVDTVLRGTLAYFTQGILGYFVSREGERPLEVVGRSIHRSQHIPLVVLIGPNTVSYGEIFAGILKDQQRAFLIGEPTEGNIETLWSYEFRDGSRAWIARETFRPFANPDENWEDTGILPHLTVIANWDEFTMENDPAIQAALNYFDQQ